MTYLLIDNYDSFTWNLVHRFGECGALCHVVRNDQADVDELLNQQSWDGIILSPGPCDPDKAGICLDLVAACDKMDRPLPLFGVCLGHQTIAQYFGGQITKCTPKHGKTDMINVTHHDDLFQNCPARFEATRYHSLHVRKNSLDNSPMLITARTDDHINMAIAHKSKPFYGVQFHPESIKTQTGFDIISNFLTLSTHYNRDNHDG